MFNEECYVEILNNVLLASPTKGLKSKLSIAAKCHASHLSQVLSKKVDLSLDQAFAIGQYLGWSDLEIEYFLTLVSLSRSGSRSLSQYYHTKLANLRDKSTKLSNRLKTEKNLKELAEKYYSAWYYSAVHIILTIPEYKTPDAIAAKLNIPRKTVLNALKVLHEIGIVTKTAEGLWEVLEFDLHIPANSPLYNSYHINWRNEVSRLVQINKDKNLHYTGLHSMSRKDYEILRERIMELIEESRSLVSKSKEEDLVLFAVDLLNIGT
ncbi:MAG: TIGR02147 family protein [Bdellovibrionota bacterium]